MSAHNPQASAASERRRKIVTILEVPQMKPHLHGHCIIPTDPETLEHVGECTFEYDNYCEDPTCEIDGLDTIAVIAHR